MAGVAGPVEVYLEVGSKRVFAGAVEWPGWCRVGRDESAALEALVAYGPRYAQALRGSEIAFEYPADVSALRVVEHVPGNTSTDFGAPDVAPAADSRPVDDAELARLESILRACWAAFDAGVRAVTGHTLRTGPRGGGRDVGAMVAHVMGAEQGYLGRLAWKRPTTGEDQDAALALTRGAVLDALAAAARGEVPERGPRGGVIWKPRYFARRVAWHVLDHLWELEDRLV